MGWNPGLRGSYEPTGHVCRKFRFKSTLKRAERDVMECGECGSIRLGKAKGEFLLGDLGVR
jgi:ribosomal protein L37AE/L43A